MDHESGLAKEESSGWYQTSANSRRSIDYQVLTSWLTLGGLHWHRNYTICLGSLMGHSSGTLVTGIAVTQAYSEDGTDWISVVSRLDWMDRLTFEHEPVHLLINLRRLSS